METSKKRWRDLNVVMVIEHKHIHVIWIRLSHNLIKCALHNDGKMNVQKLNTSLSATHAFRYIWMIISDKAARASSYRVFFVSTITHSQMMRSKARLHQTGSHAHCHHVKKGLMLQWVMTYFHKYTALAFRQEHTTGVRKEMEEHLMAIEVHSHIQ